MNSAPIFQPHRKTNGFTLIELLVVIAIIAILLVGAVGLYGKIFGNARKKEAAMNCTALKTAINKYFSETDFLPGFTNATGDEVERDTVDEASGLVDILVGKSADSKTNYLEGMKQAKTDKGKTVNGLDLENGEAKIYDPWGGPYKIVMSYKGAQVGETGGIENPNTSSKLKKIRERVIVYSAGEDKKFETWADNVKSWDDGE